MSSAMEQSEFERWRLADQQTPTLNLIPKLNKGKGYNLNKKRKQMNRATQEFD